MLTYLCRPHVHRQLSNVRTIYSKFEGVPSDWILFAGKEIDLRPQSVYRWYKRKQWENLVLDQALEPERLKILGPDLSLAHFLLPRSCAVKFVGAGNWIEPLTNDKKNKNLISIPSSYVKGLHIEAVDCSKTNIMYESFDNFKDVKYLRYINISECTHIDDWTLNRFHMFDNSLEYLDISGCKNISERGIASLATKLPKLKYLRMKDMPSVNYSAFVEILLEDLKPTLKIEGVPDRNVPTDVMLEPIFISGLILHDYENAVWKKDEKILISEYISTNEDNPLLLEASINYLEESNEENNDLKFV